MPLLINNEEVEQVLTMADTLAVLEELYGDIGSGSAVYRPRTDLHTPTTTSLGPDIPGAHYLKSMDGAYPRRQVASIRLTSDVLAYPIQNGLRRRVKIPAAPGNKWLGLVLLFSTSNGELLAIMNDGVLQRFRVGATNGIGAKYLARKDARTACILGSGWQAGTQLMALCAVRPLIEDIKRKDFAVSAPLEDREVCEASFLEVAAGGFRKSAPLVRFLCEAVGLPF